MNQEDLFTVPENFELTITDDSRHQLSIITLHAYLNKSEEWLRTAHSVELNRHSVKHREQYEELFAQHGSDEGVAVAAFQEEEDLRLRRHVTLRSMRYAFVMLLFATLEIQLRTLCKVLKAKRNLPIGLNDLKGDDLDKSKVFLTKLAGLKLPSNWEQIRNLSDIRNCIAHAGGCIEESRDEDKLRNLVDKVPGYSVNQDVFTGDNLIELAEDFCVRALEEVEKLLDELCEAAAFDGKRPTSLE